ncbi:ROK family protein [candidate division WS5 bacterium]|uniref:ROK family protein n=1 Tax=candidate division WS5 bacterium TaxID=2093353 RepID=A0A419DAP7_9BACT|nr:MAG: ROK family protein [candidate division WS5 bacterium]
MEKESRNIITIDIGGTNIRIGLIDSNGKIEKITRLKKPHIGEISELILSTIKTFFSKEELKNAELIAVASAGKVDNEKGTLKSSSIGKGVLPLGKDLKEEFSKDVILINDANAAAYGEFSKYRDRTNNLVYITISTGIGGGAVVDGRLLGAEINATEIGHIIVKEEDYHILCNCGFENHWEAFASGKGIPKFFKEWAKKKGINQGKSYTSAEDIFQAAKKGGSLEKRFLEKIGEYNGRGLSTIMALYMPDIVVIGGSVVHHNQKEILEPMIKNTEKHYKLPEIIITESGDDVCIIGAAMYAFDNLREKKYAK